MKRKTTNYYSKKIVNKQIIIKRALAQKVFITVSKIIIVSECA